MNTVHLWKLTWRENLGGQVVWIAAGTGVLILTALAALSGAALTYQDRLVDVSTYFLVDAVTFLTGLFLGAGLFSRDFTSRGLAELLVPRGVGKHTLYLGRLSGLASLLAALALVLFLFRGVAFALADGSQGAFSHAALVMFLFCATKTALALSVGALLGVFVRPVIALLAGIGLFLFGHFSSGVSGLHGVAEEGGALVSPVLGVLFRIVRVWNPNFLVLESFQGGWETPTVGEVLLRLSWGAGAIALCATLGACAARMKEVGAARAG